MSKPKNIDNKDAVSHSPAMICSADGHQENAERILLQKIYDNLQTATNEYGALTSAWMDTVVYSELEDFLYPSENEQSA